MMQPSPWITRFAPLIRSGGRVVDLAAGSGRHSRWLAARGYRVLAVDRDADALAGLQGIDGIETLEADLESENWPLEGMCFDGVIVSNYLYRPRLPALPALLEADGILLCETFARGQEALGRPRNPDYLLKTNELLEAFAGELQVIAYEHLHDDPPAIRQRICARRRN